MLGGVKLVVDSGSQGCGRLVDRYEAAVVPLTIVLDDEALLEGVTVTNELFYERLAGGAVVSTAAPGPGQLLSAYRDAADAGATAVLSVHLASALSGTVNSARLAAEMSPIPVEIVDSDTCAWGIDAMAVAAAQTLASGKDIAAAVAAAHRQHERLINLFTIGQPELLERGGRSPDLGHDIETTSLLAARHRDLVEVGKVDSLDAFIETAVTFLRQETLGQPIKLAVGDARSPGVADRLAEALGEAIGAGETHRYEMSPSLAAHLGVGSIVISCYAVA